jgi:hypothetical protein
MVRVNTGVDCVCDEAVPQTISVDLSGAQKGDVFRLNSLSMPPKVRPATTVPSDLVVCVIKSTRK